MYCTTFDSYVVIRDKSIGGHDICYSAISFKSFFRIKTISTKRYRNTPERFIIYNTDASVWVCSPPLTEVKNLVSLPLNTKLGGCGAHLWIRVTKNPSIERSVSLLLLTGRKRENRKTTFKISFCMEKVNFREGTNDIWKISTMEQFFPTQIIFVLKCAVILMM